MGRYDSGLANRSSISPRRDSLDYTYDAEAARSPAHRNAALEPRLLKQILFGTALVTALVFLLLLAGGKPSWKRPLGAGGVLVAEDEAQPSSRARLSSPALHTSTWQSAPQQATEASKSTPVRREDSAPDGSPGASSPPLPKLRGQEASSAPQTGQGTAGPVEATYDPQLPPGWRWDEYHNHSRSVFFMEWLKNSFPRLVKVKVVGGSSMGLNIHAMEITAPDDDGDARTYKPMFKWLGGMHGDEQPSVELLMRLAYHLASGYGMDARVTQLLRAVRVQLLPCLNQDGRRQHRRTNHADVDINRNFPLDDFNYKIGPAPKDVAESAAIVEWRKWGAGPVERETDVAMLWYKMNAPTFLSANVHGGALVANYPLDACDSTATTAPCPTEEGDLPLQLAQVYSFNHPTMHHNAAENFQNGTVNGAVWYPVIGSLQDWVYHTARGMHLTMELHKKHTELARDLPGLWDDNLQPLIRFTEMVYLGLLLWVADGTSYLEASVQVVSPSGIRNATAFIDHKGRPAHFKLLSPGVEYCLEVRPRGEGFAGDDKAATEYQPVLVGVKLPKSLDEVIKGEGVAGLRIEHTVKVSGEWNKEKPIVKLGAASDAVCQNG